MAVKIYIGDCRQILKTLPASSAHCVITSPPYWGLRDYGTEPTLWGESGDCGHVWGNEQIQHQRGKVGENSTLDGGPQSGGDGRVQETSQGQFCQLCNAWRGNLGLEPTPQLFVEHIVECFREVRRVLRSDGCVFVNLGDSYATNGGSRSYGSYDGETGRGPGISGNRIAPNGLKSKDLIGIPWRVALALQADGWWLRSDIIWAKGVSFCDTYSGSCMPESVRDRPTKSHEYIFLLTKSARYFWDQEAVRENFVDERMGNPGKYNRSLTAEQYPSVDRLTGNMAPGAEMKSNPAGRNLRTVWTINPGSYPGSHFATFPPDLVKPMIAAGTSEKGCCPDCGANWVRVVEKGFTDHGGKTETAYQNGMTANRLALLRQAARENGGEYVNQTKTIGWKPTCTCNAGDPIPCTVLDPFAGAGTTALQADRMSRGAIIIELNETYARKLAYPRIANDAPMFSDVEIIHENQT